MLLHKSSLHEVISFRDIKDKIDLVASKLEEVIEDVSQRIRTYDSKVIEIRGSVSNGAV